MDIVFVLCIILMPILLIGQIILWYRQKEIISKPTNIIIQRFGQYEWLIYLWFSIGIVALLFIIFQIDNNSVALRQNVNTSENILSILITFLVAWQIWQTIISKQTIEKLQQENQETRLQAQLNVNDSTLLCTAILAAHEGLEAWMQHNDAPTAYTKYVAALNNYVFMQGKTINKEEAIKDCEKHLNTFLNEAKKITNQIERQKFKQYDKDIETIYNSIIDLSQKVQMPNGFIERLKNLNKERKELLKQWGY